jgi:hypothetical protein
LKAGGITAAALRKSSNENPALKAGENTAAALRKSSNKNPAWKIIKLERTLLEL